jgi:hypothetical protein
VRTIKLLLTVLFLASIFTACEKEYSAENGLLPGGGIPGGGGGGGGGGGVTGCKSCTYQPWCDGSVYTYIDTSGGSATPSTSTLDIIADTSIDGKTYSKTLSEGNFSYHNCTGGITSLIALQPNPLGGSSIRVNTTILKENLPVGSTWTEVNPTGAGVDNTYDYEIIAKGVSRTVLGVTYSDVIQVHQTLSVDIPIFGPLPVSETDYYFARNIGLIESLIIDGTLGTQILHRVLQSYTIP